jgi:polysaccharide export outer membrane protein
MPSHSTKLERSRIISGALLGTFLICAALLPGPASAKVPGTAPAQAEGAEAAAPEKAARPSREAIEYTIGVEDLLEISVWKNPDLSSIVPVRPDGKISLPLIDDVQAAGRTPVELKKVLTDRWKAYLSAPEVSVIVKEVNSYKVYMVGEVTRPGELRVKARIRLLQAISLAGGFTAFADRDKILVLRDASDHELRYEIDYDKIVSGNRPEDNLVLLPGDTVVVP